MASRHNNRTDRRWDIALALAGLVGLVIFVAFHDRAFPAAALDLKLSRREIADRGRAYMAGLGYNLDGYTLALTFREAGWASIYLQRTLGVPGANALARDERLPLWYWHARWFRPLQKEEFSLDMLPDGEPVSLYHSLPEDTAGASLSQAEGRALAETYLIQDRGWALAGWEELSASSNTRPGGRIDHSFTWKRTDWHVGDSQLKLSVGIQGDRVDSYSYWLDVPEAFERRFSEQHNRASFIDTISTYLGIGTFMGVAALFFVLGHRRGIFPWHEGLGMGLAVAGVGLLADLNALPLAGAGYDTTQDYGVFWSYQVGNALQWAALMAAAVAILWAGGRAFARRVWPQQDRVLPRGEDRLVALGRSTWRGVMLGAVSGGYVVLFYLAAAWLLGGWVPIESPSVDLYATPLPLLSALSLGVGPGVIEETLFRLVGIGLLLLVTRRRWIALVVPGALWALAHLSYVRDPIWLRGLELTIDAMIWGWAFLRFGLATTITAHLTYNAGLIALPLVRSGEPYFVANGVLVLLLILTPAAAGAIRAWLLRRRGIAAGLEPEIRPLSPADAGAVGQLLPAGAAGASWAGGPAAGLWVGERLEGAAVACDGQVSTLYVAPGWRRRYWGSRLAQALAAALPPGTPLRVEVPAGSWRLARFWDSLGWQPAVATYARPIPDNGRPGWREWTRRLRRRDATEDG